MSLFELLHSTLVRELDEELGVTQAVRLEPLRRVVDLRSVEASRHIAFVFEATVDAANLRLGAPEEFSRRSKFNLLFLSVDEIKAYRRQLDPWSSLIYDHVLARDGASSVPRQYPLLPPFLHPPLP
jgi:8-oxo-dGTP pyrophosphatase MutT (NUDIX family)